MTTTTKRAFLPIESFLHRRQTLEDLLVLEGGGLPALAGATSAGDLGSAGGDVGLGVLAGAAGGTEVLVGLAAGAASAHQEGVLAGGGDGGELVEGEALTAGTLDALAGVAGEAEGADAELAELVDADVIEDVTDDDGDGGLGLGGVLPDGLALEDDGEAGEGDGGAVAAGLEEALVDGLVEGRLGAGGQELVELQQKLDVGVGGVGGLADEVLGLAAALSVSSHVEMSCFFGVSF